MVAASAAPYGYTISIWSSGAVLLGTHGTPRVAEVFAFLAGALTGFGLLGLLAHGAFARGESLDHAPDRVLAGALHWLAAGGAVGAAVLVAKLPGWEAWPLASFAATTIYILIASAQLALVTARRGEPPLPEGPSGKRSRRATRHGEAAQAQGTSTRGSRASGRWLNRGHGCVFGASHWLAGVVRKPGSVRRRGGARAPDSGAHLRTGDDRRRRRRGGPRADGGVRDAAD